MLLTEPGIGQGGIDSVQTVYAIDYDGVIGHVRHTAELFAEAVALEDPDLSGLMRQEQEKAEAQAGSFDMWGYLEGHVDVTQDRLDEFESQFRGLAEQRGREALLYADSEDFLTTMATKGLKFFIMTYGGQKWQTMKLEASGVAGKYPYIVAAQEQKGVTIDGWRQSDSGMYVCTGITGTQGEEIRLEGDRIVLLDDKAKSFYNLPAEDARAYGYHLLREGEVIKESQKGAVPNNVTKIASLRAFMEAEGIAA